MPTDVIRPFLPAIAVALLASLLGYGLGVGFGLAEDSFKGALQQSADAALADRYQGDAEAAKAVANKSWSYLKRAHMHAGALGTSSLVLSILLALLGDRHLRLRQAAALSVSVGGLGYGLFWLCAGFAAPGLGSTGAGKEAYGWLAQPSSALIVLGTVGTLALVIAAFVQKPARA